MRVCFVWRWLSVVLLARETLFTQAQENDVPIQDRCRPVGMPEPPECPATIGPPCPNCYTNDQPDWVSGDDLSFSQDTLDKMQQRLDDWVDFIVDNYPPSYNYPKNRYDVFSGMAGRAQLFLRLYSYSASGSGSSGNTTYLSLANEYLSQALKFLPQTEEYPSYFFGSVGVWTVAAVLNEIESNEEDSEHYISLIQQSINDTVSAMNGTGKVPFRMDICGIDEGFSGMLWTALFLNDYFGDPRITEDQLSVMVNYIISIGLENGQLNGNDYLQYECPFADGCYMWGMGHGSGGVLKILLTAARRYSSIYRLIFNNDRNFEAMMNTLQNFLDVQLEDGNFPTAVSGSCEQYYGTDPDQRVQWCHGAPGFADVQSDAALMMRGVNDSFSEKLMDSAQRAADAVWDRGLLVKGLMFCHGIGGNSYMLWSRSQLLSEYGGAQESDASESEQSAWRAKEMIEWTLDEANTEHLRCEDSNENYSMFQGCPGVVMLYVQALQPGWPTKVAACMPGWHLCL